MEDDDTDGADVPAERGTRYCGGCLMPLLVLRRGGRPALYHDDVCRRAASAKRKQNLANIAAKRAADKAAPPKPRRPDPTTAQREYTDEELTFLKACERLRREKKRSFLTACDYLSIAKELGYRKVAEPTA